MLPRSEHHSECSQADQNRRALGPSAHHDNLISREHHFCLAPNDDLRLFIVVRDSTMS